MKVCFIAFATYPLLLDNPKWNIGGADVQQYHLAKELKNQGLEIEFITYGSDENKIISRDGFFVTSIFNRDKIQYLPNILKLLKLIKAIISSSSDVYYHEAGAEGVATIICKILKKPIIYYVPSDANVDLVNKWSDWTKLFIFRNRLDIYFSDRVICQSEYQKLLLDKNFKRDATVIKNGFPISSNTIINKKTPKYVLWVSNISDVKQPEILLNVARKLTNIDFIMIGGPGQSSKYYSNIKLEAERIPNLKFLGYIPYNKIQKYYDEASIFVNTSRFEGFPNSFLQAWMGSTPVVSLNVDPDGIICKHNLGKHSGSEGQLIDDIRQMMSDDKLRNMISNNCKKYVEEEHDISTAARRTRELLFKILKN